MAGAPADKRAGHFDVENRSDGWLLLSGRQPGSGKNEVELHSWADFARCYGWPVASTWLLVALCGSLRLSGQGPKVRSRMPQLGGWKAEKAANSKITCNR